MPPTTNEVTSVAALPHPCPHATLNGRPVRLMAIGSIEGKSPVFQYVNAEGKTDWDSQSKFTIEDTNYAPLNQQHVTR